MRNKILQKKETDNGKTAVAIAIFNHNEILLIQRRDTSVWALPGGGIEKGEESCDAAIRETKEETGFEIKILRKIAFYQPINRLAHPTHFFEGKIIGGKARPSSESKQVIFFPLEKLPKRLPPPYFSWIEDALLYHPDTLEKKITSVTYKRFFWYLVRHPILVCRFLLARLGLPINI